MLTSFSTYQRTDGEQIQAQDLWAQQFRTWKPVATSYWIFVPMRSGTVMTDLIHHRLDPVRSMPPPAFLPGIAEGGKYAAYVKAVWRNLEIKWIAYWSAKSFFEPFVTLSQHRPSTNGAATKLSGYCVRSWIYSLKNLLVLASSRSNSCFGKE